MYTNVVWASPVKIVGSMATGRFLINLPRIPPLNGLREWVDQQLLAGTFQQHGQVVTEGDNPVCIDFDIYADVLGSHEDVLVYIQWAADATTLHDPA